MTTMELDFEGFWQCRLSTDPDPTLEPRGTSGYTYVLPGESDFDRVIRTQPGEVPMGDFRQPFPPYLKTEPGGRFGVYVREVRNVPSRGIEQKLRGAAFRLRDNPVFELRNQIVGDGINRIAPPIVPFVVSVEAAGGETLLQRSDPLDPKQPGKEIWELEPDDFAQRVPVTYRHLSDEVVETIMPGLNTADDLAVDKGFYRYFSARAAWLKKQLRKKGLSAEQRAGFENRLWAIQNYIGTPQEIGLMTNRLGLQSIWDHQLRGGNIKLGGGLAAHVRPRTPWHIRFWMGGWDGDLMVGYMKGTLDIPLSSP